MSAIPSLEPFQMCDVLGSLGFWEKDKEKEGPSGMKNASREYAVSDVLYPRLGSRVTWLAPSSY